MTEKKKSKYYIIWTPNGPIIKRIDEPIIWGSEGPR